MRRRHVGESGVGRTLSDFLHAKSLIVDRNRRNPHAAMLHATPPGDPSGVLDHHPVAPLQEHTANQRGRGAGGARDHDLIRGAGHAARRDQIGRDGLPERRVAPDMGIVQHRLIASLAMTLQQPRPDKPRKLVEGRDAGLECQADGWPYVLHFRDRRRRVVLDTLAVDLGRDHLAPPDFVAEPRRDLRPGAAARLKKAFGNQLIVSLKHRDARHAQAGGERSRGRHVGPGDQPTRDHGAPDLLVDLAVERLSGLRV